MRPRGRNGVFQQSAVRQMYSTTNLTVVALTAVPVVQKYRGKRARGSQTSRAIRMKLKEFIAAIHECPDDATLEAIWSDVREQAVHDLAEAVRRSEAATRTHGMLITIDRKQKTT